jgi:hypothetical protein
VNNRITPILLAAALILGQLALLQHVLDLHSHAGDEPCELCLISTGLDLAPAHDSPPAGISQTHRLAGTWQEHTELPPVTPAFLARAPPLDLLPI